MFFNRKSWNQYDSLFGVNKKITEPSIYYSKLQQETTIVNGISTSFLEEIVE